MKTAVLNLLVLGSLVAATASRASECNAYIIKKNVVTTSFDFFRPLFSAIPEKPIQVLHSKEENMEIRYSYGRSTDFSTSINPSSQDLPVQFFLVGRAGFYERGEKPEGVFVVDVGASEFSFGTDFLDDSGAQEKSVNISCGRSENATKIREMPVFEKMGCRYAKLDANDQALSKVEGPVQAMGEHKFLYRDDFYGFTLASNGGFLTEISNTLYMSAASYSLEAPQGFQFMQHITNVSKSDNVSPALPALRLSAQCESFADRVPIELRSAPEDFLERKFQGSHSETFDAPLVVGRDAFRVQAAVYTSTRDGAKTQVRLVLPGGRVVVPTEYTREKETFHLFALDADSQELLGKIRIELQACDPNADGCVPADLIVSDSYLSGPTVSYR